MPRTNRCAYCNQRITDKTYWPYCSFHCAEWGKVYQNQIIVDKLKAERIHIEKQYKENPSGMKWPDGEEFDYTP